MLRSTLCPCHSGKALERCCGPFEHLPDPRPTDDPSAIHRSFRNHLIALIRDSSTLTELWFAFLDHWCGEDDPFEAKVDSGLLDHFLWDWFQRYQEARPLCRITQAMESVDLPMSSHIAAWADNPLEPWEVEHIGKPLIRLRRLNGNKTIEALQSFPIPKLKVGDGILGRILPHRGFRVLGLGVHRLAGSTGVARLQSLHAAALASHGLSPTVTLRPDVHNTAWLPVHDAWIRAARGIKAPAPALPAPELPAPAKTEIDLDRSREELAGQSAREAATHEMGRLRLRKWAATLPPSERATLEELLG
ncbi:MAG: SEC-C domain-containing protein [Fibrobacterota bacterium]|nr:SEC-C domain-containing protein [Fibrobacterota bacterium]QQS03058.1 MAG: SEC-C domain-containing protein [Fibrobacterota bacterium]